MSTYLFVFQEMVILPIILSGASVLVAVVPPYFRKAFEINAILVFGSSITAVVTVTIGVYLTLRANLIGEIFMLVNYLLALVLLIYVLGLVMKMVGSLLDEL